LGFIPVSAATGSSEQSTRIYKFLVAAAVHYIHPREIEGIFCCYDSEGGRAEGDGVFVRADNALTLFQAGKVSELVVLTKAAAIAPGAMCI
jgi:hypothetical protein